MYVCHTMEISRRKILLDLETQTKDREYRYIGNIWKIGNIIGNIGIVVNIGNIWDMAKKGNIGNIENVGNIGYLINIGNIGNIVNIGNK